MKFPLLLVGLALSTFPMTSSAETKTASLVLGGGCFWCTEATYELVPGVKSATSGYAGGETPNPSYEAVCSGQTGHAEVIKIEYDPAEVSLERLLEFFWTVHDPTTLNAQGNDRGTQYRSIILYADEAQRQAAEKSRTEAQAKFSDPIVTEILPLREFYTAEEYHQDYFKKNPTAGYCRFVVKPKVEKAKKLLNKS